MEKLIAALIGGAILFAGCMVLLGIFMLVFDDFDLDEIEKWFKGEQVVEIFLFIILCIATMVLFYELTYFIITLWKIKNNKQ